MAQILTNTQFIPKYGMISFDDLLNYITQNDELNSLIIIVPTGKYVRKLQQYIIRKYFNIHNKPIQTVKVKTLKEFCIYTYKKIIKKKEHLVSDAYLLALFEEAAAKANLKYFVGKNKKISPVILERLFNVVYGLKEDGITLDGLEKDIQDNKEENLITYDLSKLNDIYSLYQSYQNILGNQFLDTAQLIDKTKNYLLEKISNSSYGNGIIDENKYIFNEFLKNDESVIIYGFSEFKKPEVDFLSLFVKYHNPFAIYIDYSSKNGPIFGNLATHIEKLCISGFKLYDLNPNDEIINIGDENNLLPSVFLRRYLFNTEDKLNYSKLSSIIKIFAVNTKNEEVRSIARLIKYLVKFKGIKLNEICIAIRQSEKYPTLFREIFPQYCIPVNISDRFSLSDSPVIVSIIAILNIIKDGFKLNDIHKAMMSYYLDYNINNTNQEKIDANNFVNVAMMHRMKGSQFNSEKKWIAIFESKISNTEKVLNELKNSFYDDSEYFSYKKKTDELVKAYNDFKLFCSYLPKIKEALSLDEFCEIIINQIINKFKIPNQINRFYESIESNFSAESNFEKVQLYEKAEKDSRALATFLNLLNEMNIILRERFPNQKFSFHYLLDKLKTAIKGQKYQIKEKQVYGVDITSIEQTRSIPYKVMILCGAADGEFPMAYRPETFLGKELTETKLRHFKSECMQFYQFLSNSPELLDSGEKLIYIFHPKFKGTEELVRSPFIEALLKITNLDETNSIIDLTEIEQYLKSNFIDYKEIIEKFDISYLFSLASKNELIENYVLNKTFQFNNDLSGLNYQSIKDYELKYLDYFIDSFNKNLKNSGKIELSSIPSNYLEELINKKKDSISITQLEKYAKCPFTYFISNVLNLKEEIKYDEVITPLESGSSLHSILFKFYSKIQQEQKLSKEYKIEFSSKEYPKLNAVGVKLDKQKFSQYFDLLFSIAKDEFEKNKLDSHYYEILEKENLGFGKNPGILSNWLYQELNNPELNNDDTYPLLFELDFGMNSKNKKSLPPITLDDDLKIKGKIDRVDVMAQGDDIEILISDYKLKDSGSLPSNKDVYNGISFQMPLYLAAAQKIFNDYYTVEATLQSASYRFINIDYDGKKSKAKPQKVFLNSSNGKKKIDLNSIINTSINNAKSITNKISQGQFPIQPQKNNCKYCKLNQICRIKDMK